MSNWNHVSSKLGNIQPATRSVAKEIYDAAQEAGHEIWFMWGMGPSSEHASGRALDLMVRNKAAGDWIRNYVWRNRARLRLRHVIWWQRITSTVNRPGVVRLMADRGNNTANHKDHPHIFLNPGAYQAPNQPRATTTAPSGANLVRRLQSAIKVKADGKWGPVTDARAIRLRNASWTYLGWPSNNRRAFNIRDVQGAIGTKVDGIWGPNSQAALSKWLRSFQSTIGVKSDGRWGPKTDARFLTLRRRHRNNW
jgi:hypothetical protein